MVSLTRWLKDLGAEIEDRLETDALENNRTPKQMVVSYSVQMPDGRDTSSSRSYNFNSDDELCGEMFSNKALELITEAFEGIKPKRKICLDTLLNFLFRLFLIMLFFQLKILTGN